MSKEFKKFDTTMRALLKVSHAEVKAKLEEEKTKKKGGKKNGKA